MARNPAGGRPGRSGGPERSGRSGRPASTGPEPGVGGAGAPARRTPALSQAPRTPGLLPAARHEPAPGTSYPLLLRVPPSAGEPAPWWRPMIGLFAALVLYVLVVPVVGFVLWQLGWLISGAGQAKEAFYADVLAYENVWGLVASHAGIAMLIPISVAMVVFVHRARPGWLASVVGGIRWQLLGWSLLVSAVVITLVLGVTALIEGTEYTWQPQAGFWGFLIAIMLLTPFQAAAEEVFFRGYLMQALGAFGRSPWVGIITSALVFAIFHGVQNPALFADRLAFGLLAGALVWRTGGLETAIAAHVMNNVFAFILAGLTSTIAAARALQEITWAAAAVDIAGWTALALALWFLARRRGERTLVA